MSSQFDPSTFLNFTTNEENTKRPPLPTDVEYTGVIGELEFKSGVQSKDPTKTWAMFNVPVTIDIPGEVQERLGLGMATLVINDGLMLDVHPSGQGLDMGPGKNGALRRYREATGQNKSGQPFSPSMLQGRVVRVKLKHDEYQGNLYERIAGVAAV